MPFLRSLPALAALAALALCACSSSLDSALPSGWRPTTGVVFALPAGTTLRAEVQDGLPDEPAWRAAAPWWREAWRQTVLFELREGAGAAGAAATVQLAVDPTQRTVAAFLLQQGREQVLGGDSFADGDLPGAIDRLAWTARTALGESAPAPVPVAACTSADPLVVLAVDDAQILLRDGAIGAASRALRDARRRDGSSPAVLDGIAAVDLLQGDPAAAERLCREALGYQHRLAPPAHHRLARTLQLARASREPEAAARLDRELLTLGQTVRRERPWDAQAVLTEAIAHDFLGDFAAARPLLEDLQQRLPDQPIVAYHLGWACLGTGDAASAVRAFEAAALRLPMPWVAVPRAIALWGTSDAEALEALLDRFLADAGADRPLVHDVHRMQAAHALLRARADEAKRIILKDMNWLVRNPGVLQHRAGELAEQGALLVRLGGGRDLPPILQALQAQHPSTTVADACSFLAGLVEVERLRQRATTVEGSLSRGGDSAWSELLEAYGHEVRGEARDMHNATSRAARLSSSPFTKALLVRSLRTVGQTAEADKLQQALRSEMLAIHLRRTPQHPLLGPELAFAYLAP